MPSKESGEMYLETVYILTQRNATVRSIDVAEEMNYSRASVSRGMSLLRGRGLISMDENGLITLTEAGLHAAKRVMERHVVLAGLLSHLGVDEETASRDACRIEHVISDTSLEAIKTYLSKT